MPRIRTIKPDAFKSESLSAISRGARWTFAGLWTYCDDDGLGRADPRLIKAELYPLDDSTTAADVDNDMNELIDAGCLHTYMSGGKVFIHIPGFRRHQRINRPTPSTLPPCSCGIRTNLSEPSQQLSEPPENVLPEGKGKGRGSGNGGGSADAPAPTTRPPRKCPKHLNDPDPPACRGCGDARRAHDSWQKPTLSVKPTMCGDHPDQPALNCPDCADVTRTDVQALANIRAEIRKRTA